VSFHTGDAFSNPKSENRFAYYSVTGIPSNVYDGGYQSDYYFNEGKLNSSGARSVHRIAMYLSKAVGGSTLWFKGSVTNLESGSFNGFVLVFIVENNLVDPNYPGTTWNFVFRDYGLNKTLSLTGLSTESFKGSWTIPSGVNANNVQVVAAAYDANTRDPAHGWPYPVQSVCDDCNQVQHDIGVTSLTTSKTVVGQGFNLSMSVQIANYGANTETSSVVAYAGTTTVQTKTFALKSGVSSTVTLNWNTSGFAKGNYTISAYATPVQGETDITDNTLVDGSVLLAKKGDINADGGVDVLDLIIVAKALGTHPGDLKWNPNADINGDDSIDVLDLILVAKYLGT
jgi:hypothetical protein